MLSIYERLDQIADKIESESFIRNKGLGNEIGFYVFDYDPKDEMVVRSYVSTLVKRFSGDRSARRIVEFDLFEILLAIAEQKEIAESIDDLEETHGQDYLLEALKGAIDPDEIARYIAEHIGSHNVVFITGVGKVWPVVRTQYTQQSARMLRTSP